MEQCRIDACVFSMVVDSNMEMVMVVHVDDTVITGSHETC